MDANVLSLREEQADKLAKDLGISDAITEEFKQDLYNIITML